jgi:hypothetical protein
MVSISMYCRAQRLPFGKARSAVISIEFRKTGLRAAGQGRRPEPGSVLQLVASGPSICQSVTSPIGYEPPAEVWEISLWQCMG